jgi:hypothetical protein
MSPSRRQNLAPILLDSATPRINDMTTKPRPPKQKPPPKQRWRIVIGEREQIYTSEALARKVWLSLRRSVDGEHAKLINPDGENEAQ